jgi:hypothetical protein
LEFYKTKMTEILKNIRSDQRCLFYSQMPGGNKIISFRACFIDIIDNTFRARHVACQTHINYNNCGMLTMPKSRIIKVETLEDITCQQVLLPSEILLEIDELV